jgi:hypothetical protein
VHGRAVAAHTDTKRAVAAKIAACVRNHEMTLESARGARAVGRDREIGPVCTGYRVSA